MKIRTIGAVAALALTLTACGGGDDEEASQAVAQLLQDNNQQLFDVSREQADCVGEGMVEQVGTDQLVEYGVLTEDLAPGELEGVEMSESDAESAAGVVAGCAEIKELFTGQLGDNVPAEARECIETNLTEDVIEGFLVAFFQNDMETGQQDLFAALGECVQPGS